MPTMNITREDLNACTVKLKIDCEPTQVREGYDRAFKQASKKIKLPGFRPGTVPKAMIQQYLDEEELKDLAAENVVKSTFRKAMEEQGLEPYRTPQVEVASFDLDAGSCSYVLTVPLAPKVKLGEFDGLEVARPNPDVSDSEVDEQIEEIRRRRSTREAVTDRGSQEGDMAVVNMLPDGAEGTGRNFMIVVGQTFAELDAAVAGMAIDEVKHLTLKFPDGFGEKDWAGKEMGVQLTLRSLNAIVLPELDEEFAQSMNVENVEDLRARVRDGMRNAKLQAVEDYVNEQLLEAMLQRSEVEVPDTLWQEVASRRVGILMEDLREAKKSVERSGAGHELGRASGGHRARGEDPGAPGADDPRDLPAGGSQGDRPRPHAGAHHPLAADEHDPRHPAGGPAQEQGAQRGVPPGCPPKGHGFPALEGQNR